MTTPAPAHGFDPRPPSMPAPATIVVLMVIVLFWLFTQVGGIAGLVSR